MTDKILSQRTRYWLAGKRDRRPLMALSGPTETSAIWLLSGVKRTSASDHLSIAIYGVHALSNSMILVPL